MRDEEIEIIDIHFLVRRWHISIDERLDINEMIITTEKLTTWTHFRYVVDKSKNYHLQGKDYDYEMYVRIIQMNVYCIIKKFIAKQTMREHFWHTQTDAHEKMR